MKYFLLIFLLPIDLFAAPHNPSFEEKIFHSLRKPHQQAVRSVRQLGSESYDKLKDISFSEKLPMNTRWKSFMVMTQMAGKKSMGEIERALTDSTWFMRSAGLTAMVEIDQQAAKKWAFQKMDKDPSLMVRMKAFEILSTENSEKITELFWRKLNSKENFHQKKSLWIREDLALRLSQKPRKKDLSRWVQVLHGSDQNLQKIASRALASLSQETFSEEKKDVSYWQDKFPSSKSL